MLSWNVSSLNELNFLWLLDILNSLDKYYYKIELFAVFFQPQT